MENMEQYLGRKIKGFKFEGSQHMFYHPKMDNHIGEVGVITAYLGDRFKVEFANDHWNYPANLVLEQLYIQNGIKFITKEQATALIESMTGDKYEIL